MKASTPTDNSAQQDTLLLWCVVNAALAAFAKLTKHFASPSQALAASSAQWQSLGIHKSHVSRFNTFKTKGVPAVFQQALEAKAQGQFTVVYRDQPHFPKQLIALYDCPPLLFVRGDIGALSQAQIAMVGSRKPSTAAKDIAENFAHKLAGEGFWITSGLAEGIDKHAHIGALKLAKQSSLSARTVAVLGNGILHCYPKQNQIVYDAIIARGGAIVTELLPDAKPMAHNFPRRNRLVSGLSLATLVVEAAKKSGSLITANLAAEQGKLVFAVPGHIYNTKAKGCHELIRQGAILVDSAEQVIEDLNLPKRLHLDDSLDHSLQTNDSLQNKAPEPKSESRQTHAKPANMELLANKALQNKALEHGKSANQADLQAVEVVSAQAQQDFFGEAKTQIQTQAQTQPQTQQPQSQQNDLPVYLHTLLNELDWVGQDIDTLIESTNLDVATLSGRLMELELHGLVVQQGGLYIRCRQVAY